MRDDRWQEEGQDRQYGMGSWSGRGGIGSGANRDRGGSREHEDTEQRGMHGRRGDYGRDFDRGGSSGQESDRGYGRDFDRGYGGQGRDSGRGYGREGFSGQDMERGFGGRFGGDGGDYGSHGGHGGFRGFGHDDEGMQGQGGRFGRGMGRGHGGDERGYGGQGGHGQRHQLDAMGAFQTSERFGQGAGDDVGEHTGKGPRGYQRNWDRVRESVCEALERNGRVDASDIEVKIEQGEITLTGFVKDRQQKRMAEQVADGVYGVQDVHNQIRVKRDETTHEDPSQRRASGATAGSLGTGNVKDKGSKPQQSST